MRCGTADEAPVRTINNLFMTNDEARMPQEEGVLAVLPKSIAWGGAGWLGSRLRFPESSWKRNVFTLRSIWGDPRPGPPRLLPRRRHKIVWRVWRVRRARRRARAGEGGGRITLGNQVLVSIS